MVNTSVEIGGIKFKNPVFTAAGLCVSIYSQRARYFEVVFP